MTPSNRLIVACIAAAAALWGSPAGAAPGDEVEPTASELEDRYWRWYGFISEGGMFRPDAFVNYGEPTQPEEPSAVVTLEFEIAEPEPEPLAETTIIYVDPTIAEACNLSESPVAYFEFDESEPLQGQESLLDRLGRCLAADPILSDDYLSITGHADPRGTEEYNRGLGLDRADAVAALLMDHGVEQSRIDTYSWGEAQASDDPEQWDQDRKVVVQLDR